MLLRTKCSGIFSHSTIAQNDDLSWFCCMMIFCVVASTLLDGGVELGHVAEFGVAPLEHDVEGKRLEFFEVVLKFFADHGHGGFGIVLGTSAGFEKHIVDAAEEFDIACGVAESGGG